MSASTNTTTFAIAQPQLNIGQLVNRTSLLEFQQSSFFQAVLESLVDGILILNKEGKVVHANAQATHLCQQINTSRDYQDSYDQLPPEILRVRQSLMECRQIFPHRQMIIESEVITTNSTTLRLRGRWLNLGDGTRSYLLITMEDCQQSLDNLVSADRRKYGLTAREAEIWSLRRTNHSYKEIAAKLYISENTVKKHMKSINAKRKQLIA